MYGRQVLSSWIEVVVHLSFYLQVELHMLIEILPAHKNKDVRFRSSCARFSILIRGSSGYAGRDLQGGTSDGSV